MSPTGGTTIASVIASKLRSPTAVGIYIAAALIMSVTALGIRVAGTFTASGTLTGGTVQAGTLLDGAPACPVAYDGGPVGCDAGAPILVPGSFVGRDLALTAPLATSDVVTTDVTGDTVDRFVVNADGTCEWGPGNGALDTDLYRSGANALATDDAFSAYSITASTGDVVATVGDVTAGDDLLGTGLQVTQNGIGTTVTTDPQIVVKNTTEATAGVPLQYSPILVLEGTGWDTDGAGASRRVQYGIMAVTTTGAQPYGTLSFRVRYETATGTWSAWVQTATLNVSGLLAILSNFSAGAGTFAGDLAVNGLQFLSPPDGAAVAATAALKTFHHNASVADDASISLYAVTTNAFGRVVCGTDAAHYAEFTIDSTGTVSLLHNSADVVANADTDAKLDIGTAATQEPLLIKNRLGATHVCNVVVDYD